MKADGCKYKGRRCEFPKDRLADIIPVALTDGHPRSELYYQISWNSMYRDAPLVIRMRQVCMRCALMVQAESLAVAFESAAIDKYYERSDREARTRTRLPQNL